MSVPCPYQPNVDPVFNQPRTDLDDDILYDLFQFSIC